METDETPLASFFPHRLRAFFLIEPDPSIPVVGYVRYLAEGVQFGDGTVVICWRRRDTPRLDIFANLAAFEAQHVTGWRSVEWR